MTSSQENAVASALKELGVEFDQRMNVAAIAEGRPQPASCRRWTMSSTVNGKPVTGMSVVQAELDAGTGKPVNWVVVRDGKSLDVEHHARQSERRRRFHARRHAAGLRFPLRSQDLARQRRRPECRHDVRLGHRRHCTPGEMTGGKHIAGTGTIDPEGNVGPIGGIVQKMDGARARAPPCSWRRPATAAKSRDTCRTACRWSRSKTWTGAVKPSNWPHQGAAHGSSGLLQQLTKSQGLGFASLVANTASPPRWAGAGRWNSGTWAAASKNRTDHQKPATDDQL